MKLGMSSTFKQFSLHSADTFPSAKKEKLTVQVLFTRMKAGWDLIWHCEAPGLFLGGFFFFCIHVIPSLLKGIP